MHKVQYSGAWLHSRWEQRQRPLLSVSPLPLLPMFPLPPEAWSCVCVRDDGMNEDGLVNQ